MNLDMLLRIMVDKGASDLHLKVGCLPHLRIDGELVSVDTMGRLEKEDSLMMALSVMNDQQKIRFRENAEVDIGHSLRGVGRFRINVFQQRGNASMAIHAIPSRIQPLDELLLPPILKTIVTEPQGLVLVTGSAGSGKSTTIASMISHINENFTRHIITIEDPIEYSHPDRVGIVSQREVGVDASSFTAALQSSMRQDPDVIMVGKPLDLETVETMLNVAETGHLVLCTMHAMDAVETINRIVTMFPVHQHRQVRMQLSIVLRAIISQRLIHRSDAPGRIPAVEVLRTTDFIRNCIVEPDKTKLILDAIASSTSQYGMQSFDQSIYNHYKAGRITKDDAFAYCSNPEDFKLHVQGIYSTKDAARASMQHSITR